ncbi:unnamed protein product [Closterium sp. Naga37s-1]|nr:unnamed protein product [Closterium sp. Naga37s-1]
MNLIAMNDKDEIYEDPESTEVDESEDTDDTGASVEAAVKQEEEIVTMEAAAVNDGDGDGVNTFAAAVVVKDEAVNAKCVGVEAVKGGIMVKGSKANATAKGRVLTKEEHVKGCETREVLGVKTPRRSERLKKMFHGLDVKALNFKTRARQAGLLTPGDASYWVSGANFTASEHAAVMMIEPFVLEGEVEVICSRTIVAFLDWHETFVRAAEHTDESLSAFDTATRRMVQLVESTFPREHSGWNLVKVHLLLHLTEAIRRGGLPREYSAAVYENAHIRTCKRPYRRSNHRDVGRVIAQQNTNAALLTRIPTNLEGDRQYNTAMRRAIASGLPQLCRQRSRMHSAITDREQAPLDLYATYDAAIPGGIGPYAYLTRLFGYVSFPAWVHTALALPARGTDHGLIRPHYVRANPSHHGAATFSFIEYEDGTGETVVGRVHLLLTLMMNSEDAHPAGEAVAFVRQWYPSLEDECTGCMRMRSSDDELSYDLVPVASVHRTVHMVESFVTPGLWYLNSGAATRRLARASPSPGGASPSASASPHAFPISPFADSIPWPSDDDAEFSAFDGEPSPASAFPCGGSSVEGRASTTSSGAAAADVAINDWLNEVAASMAQMAPMPFELVLGRKQQQRLMRRTGRKGGASGGGVGAAVASAEEGDMQGAVGVIRRCVHRSTGEIAACKSIRKAAIQVGRSLSGDLPALTFPLLPPHRTLISPPSSPHPPHPVTEELKGHIDIFWIKQGYAQARSTLLTLLFPCLVPSLSLFPLPLPIPLPLSLASSHPSPSFPCLVPSLSLFTLPRPISPSFPCLFPSLSLFLLPLPIPLPLSLASSHPSPLALASSHPSPLSLASSHPSPSFSCLFPSLSLFPLPLPIPPLFPLPLPIPPLFPLPLPIPLPLSLASSHPSPSFPCLVPSLSLFPLPRPIPPLLPLPLPIPPLFPLPLPIPPLFPLPLPIPLPLSLASLHNPPSTCMFPVEHVHVVMELGEGGDLFDCIDSHERLSEPSAACIFRSLMLALQHCHSHAIVHRDVKPENILLSDHANNEDTGKANGNDCEVKLIDFGLTARHTPGVALSGVFRALRRYDAAPPFPSGSGSFHPGGSHSSPHPCPPTFQHAALPPRYPPGSASPPHASQVPLWTLRWP